jgi:NitT/TauT family transport system substrate-binding protein
MTAIVYAEERYESSREETPRSALRAPHRRLGILSLAAALVLAACVNGPNAGGAVEFRQLRLPMGYIPNIQYAPFYVAVEQGYFREAGLEIQFDYSFETDGVALVGAGELPFALVSGEQVLLARAQDLPVVLVASWFQEYPISVVSKAEHGLQQPQDLSGRKIGLPGLFGANYVGLLALLYSAGMEPSQVTLDSIGFNQVEALATDQEEAVVVYTANEPIVLRAQGYQLNEIRVADFVQLASNGILSNEGTIAGDPALVGEFIAAFLRGLEDTVANPEQAIRLSAAHIPEFDTLDQAIQRQVLTASIELWTSERPGFSDPQAWENMQAVLLQMGLLKTRLDLRQAFTNEFVP